MSTAHHVYLVVVTLLLGWVAQLHLAQGANSKAQFVVLLLAVFGGVLCWVWSNTIRQLKESSSVPFSALDYRTPFVFAAFYAVIAILAVGRIL
ncbi:MAG: RipA family octameric membrane protein [Nevskiaceae bacterium]